MTATTTTTTTTTMPTTTTRLPSLVNSENSCNNSTPQRYRLKQHNHCLTLTDRAKEHKKPKKKINVTSTKALGNIICRVSRAYHESHPFRWMRLNVCYFCSHSAAFFDIRVLFSIDESFPCSLVHMLVVSFNRTRVENIILHSNTLNKANESTNE